MAETSPSEPDPASGERLRAVLETAVDGIITIDERGTIESANPAAERLFGYTRAELLGRNVSMLMPSPYQGEHDQYLENYLRTGDRRIIGSGREVAGRRRDGSTFPMYLAVSEVHDGDRRLFTGVVHDLAKLKEAEQAAARFGRVLEESLNEIYIFDATTLQFLFVNRGARENLGYSMEELRALTPLDLKPDYDAARLESHLAPLRSGELLVVDFETRHRRKDGGTYPVEVHVQFPRVAGPDVFVAIVLDITERNRAREKEQRLNTQLEERLQELRIRDEAIQSASEGIVIADATAERHPLVFVNRAFEEMTGYTAAEAIGRSCCLLHGDDDEQPGVKTLMAALRELRGCHTVVRNYRRDGTMFWNEISIAPVAAADGHATHIVGVMQDVTERRVTQERLVQTERLAAIGEMVTGLAHESRNALQRAQACLDMLSLDLEGRPEQMDLTDRTRRALDDLRRLYEEVRSYAAPINLECRKCRLSTLWQNVWDDLALARSGHEIELIEPEPAPETELMVDGHRIQQVFRNVLENSISACPDAGEIEIECRDDQPDEVTVVFRDNGPGFGPDARSQAFQPFFTTKQKGTGLGMAIARRIVELHGGRIRIADDSGSGAVVEVTLPR